MKKLACSFRIFCKILVVIGAANVVCLFASLAIWGLTHLALFMEYEVSRSDFYSFSMWYPRFAFTSDWVITALMILTTGFFSLFIWYKINKQKEAQKLSLS